MDTKIICLAVLSQGDATGYEIKGAFEEGPFSYFQDVSFGSIYPALTRALEDELVSVTNFPQAGRPGKKVYAITSKGRGALLDAFAKETPGDKVTCDFLFKALYSQLLGPTSTQTMIDRRVADLGANIDRLENCDHGTEEMGPREAFVSGFGLAIYRAMRAYILENGDKLVAADRKLDHAVSAAAAD